MQPATGIILPQGAQELRINFISTKVVTYALSMLVDIEAVGDSLLSLPITAECIVPDIRPSSESIDYGESFIGYKYEQAISISNPSHLPANFEVIDEAPMLKAIGEHEVIPSRGQIDPHSQVGITVKFTARRLGPMCLPLYVRIVGLEEAAFVVELNAHAIGPQVVLSSPRLDWGKAQVLTDAPKTLTLDNNSLVPAVFKLLLRKPNSPFSLPLEEFTMAPKEKYDLTLTAHMDDTVRSTNDLILQIMHAPEIVVPLSATGVGATITASRPMDTIHFGEQFSSRIIKEEFTLSNLGRKAQQLTWINTATIPPPKDKKAAEDGDVKPPSPPIFNVTPDKVLMEPGATCTFTVRGLAPSAGERTETLQCTAQVGTAKGFPIFETAATCCFIEPLVDAAPASLDFVYMYAAGDEAAAVPLHRQKLKLKNVSPLPLTMVLRVGAPFAVDRSEFSLFPGDACEAEVMFDPNYPGDLVSRRFADSRLQLSFKEHPQKIFVPLVGQTHYPNLAMNLAEANFGCILNDAPSKLTMGLTNTSAVGAQYTWSFALEDASPQDPTLAFDVLPIRGYLEAGATETVELLYKGGMFAKCRAVAQCHVVGGPTYELPLLAESSEVQYKLDRTRLDFGLLNYDKVEEKEIYLANTGRVAFSYTVNKTQLSRKNVVELLPPGGTINAGDKLKLLVRVLPGLPTKLTESIYLQVAHFPPEEIVVTVEGIYPRISLNLARDRSEAYEIFYAEAEQKVNAEKMEDEALRLGLPSPRQLAAEAPLAELDPPALLAALSSNYTSLRELLGSWGKLAESEGSPAALSREEFRIAALVVAGPVATTVSAHAAFAKLAADAGASSAEASSAEADAAVDVTDSGAKLAASAVPVATLLAACEPPRTRRTPRPVSVGDDEDLVDGAGEEAADDALGATSTAELLPVAPDASFPAGTMPSPPPTGMSRKSVLTKGEGAASMRSDATGRYRIFLDSDIDVEAERIALTHYANDVLSRHCVEVPPPATAQSGVSAPPRASTAGTGSRSRYQPTIENMPPPPPGFKLSTYVLDFGNIIKGTQKKKVFKLRNAGWGYVSLDIDKNAIAPYGLRVEPDKLVKLPGLPEPESAEFTVTFASKAGKVALGRMTQELRLDLKPGPPVAILVKANVTIPEIRLTVPEEIMVKGMGSDSIDFGAVIAGQCSTATIVLHNFKEVLAEWAVKPPIEAAKDFGFFQCFPDSGTLAPGARLQVQVRFTPNAERDFAVRVMFKLANNNKPVYLSLFGQGKELKVVAAPSVVSVPAVMPYAPPESVDFELVNPSEYPVEVYSVEFDQAFAQHEAILREDTSAPTVVGDALILPPRMPGEPFWPALAEAHAEKLRMLEEAEAARLAAEARAAAEAAGEELPEEEEVAEVATKEDEAADGVGELEEAEPEPPKRRTLVILTPAPLSQSAELAASVAAEYQVPVVVMADLVAQEARKMKEAAREAKEQERAAAAEAAAAAAEAGTDGTAEAPTKDDEAEDEAEDESLQLVEADALNDCIAAALSREAMPDGCVILLPETASPHAPTNAMLESIAASLPEEAKWSFTLQTQFEAIPEVESGEAVEVEGAPAANEAVVEQAEAPAELGAETVAMRAEQQLEARLAAMPDVGPMPDMDEEAYEVLDDKGRDSFEKQRRGHRRKLAVADAKVAAAKLTHEHRLVTLRKEHEGFAEIAETAGRLFAVEPPEPPPPPAEGEEPVEVDTSGLPGHFTVDASLPVEKAHLRLVQDLFTAPLPIPEEPPPPDIPLPFTNHIIKRPRPKPVRTAPEGMRLLTLPPPPVAPEEGEGAAPAEAPAAEPSAPVDGEAEGEEAAELPEPTEETRWVLPAKGSVALRLLYSSAMVGKMMHALRFEITDGVNSSTMLNTSALCTRPSISTDPRNVFNRKVKARDPLKVKKSYVVIRKCFEFGPLLVNRPQPPPAEEGDDAPPPVPPHKDHDAPLHITNNSPFPVTVHFSFLADGVALWSHQPRPFSPPPQLLEEDATDVEGGESKDVQPPAEEEVPTRTEPKPVFFLQDTSLTLEPDQTKDLRLSAFPDIDGLFEENLMCTISNNPEPVQFPISCIGSSPAVAISSAAVVFERLLMGRSDTKVVTIGSRSALPVRWSIPQEDLDTIAGTPANEEEGTEEIGPSYTVTPTSGYLAPGEVATVSVTFHARDAGECARLLHVVITDGEEPPVLPPMEPMPIELQAEAYDINVQVEWPDEESYKGLDFGSFKVVDEKTSSLELLNEGKYEVGFKFLFKSKMMKNILTFTPNEGTLVPAENRVASRLKVEVTFKASEEVTLRDNADVRLKFTEVLTSEVLDDLTTPVRVSAHAVFSKYVLVPRGINFGPMVYDTQKERTFELTNTGEFEFDFTLRNKADDPEAAGKGGGGPELKLGRFTVSPAVGTVPAGGYSTITVKFAAGSDAEKFNEDLIVDVADRDAVKEPEGVLYELIAESCIPGIETKDHVNIFEEQAVHRTMTLVDTGLPTNVYAQDENLFCFGSHMVGKDVAERFKLLNPFKVPCKVLLDVKARAAKGGSKGDPAGEVPFEVQPSELLIPPHEHRYVTCFFKPTGMQTYYATLEAAVELGTNPDTKLLTFDLMAEGTLPHVTVLAPTARTDEGLPVLAFPKLLVGRTHRLPLTLRNEGVLPATVSISQLVTPGPFSCNACGQSISMPAMGEETVEIIFKPVAAGEVASSINLTVHQNDFEDVALQLRGEGNLQQVAFDDLPPPPESAAADAALEDCLAFGDVDVGVPKVLTFTLRNFSDQPRRFVFSSLQGLSFAPSIGHLLPHGSKSITATFSSAEPLSYTAERTELTITKIVYPGAGPRAPAVEWDNAMTSVKYLTEEEYLAREARVAAEAAAVEGDDVAESKAPAADDAPHMDDAPPSPSVAGSPSRGRKKVVEVEPEPTFEEVPVEEGEEAEAPLPLAISAKSEYASVECETTSLAFRSTMMFQVRSHSFPLVNSGSVALHYRWRVTNADGTREPLPSNEAPFSASPAFGVVPPGETINTVVSFSPAEVDSFKRTLTCVCKNLHPDATPPVIALIGKSSRPYCHFEVAESDYVRAGRRSPDMPGPDGSLSPLDPATKVIEFNSLGTRVRNTKRFYVVNPTNKTYDFVWTPASEDVPAADSLGVQPFRCQTRKGVILAGRKFEMVFHFTPEAVDIAESHWRFQVPELQIDVPFLLVGTIQEPGVSLDRTRHDFGPLLIGQKARETLHIVNTEHLPFSFSFEKTSFAAGPSSGESVVSVDPLTGVVGPNSSLPIELTFAPSLEKNFNFNMELRVRNKPQPLVLNVKGQGYTIHDTIHLADSNGKLVEVSSYSPTRVDFGLVHVNDKIIRQLQITNSGRFNYDVSLTLKVPPGVRMPPVAVTPELATVKKNERLMCQLAYSPTSEAPLPQGLALHVQVTNGRSYTLQLLGRGRRPKLNFSFMKHDFGPCFVVTPRNGMKEVTTVLTLVNEDEHEVYFDMPYDPDDFLTASVDRTTIAPGEFATVSVAFAPQAAGHFSTTLPFLINGLWSVSVAISGEGCDLRLELSDPNQQQLQLGMVSLSQSLFRSVGLVNRSRRPVEVSLAAAAEKLQAKSIALSFAGGGYETTLRPRESRAIELRFAPSARLPQFSEAVIATVVGLPRPLLVVTGACVAMDLQLEMEQLSFGQATLNSRITRPLMLQNL